MTGELEIQRLAVVAEDLGEVFRIYKERPPGLKERLYRFRRSHYEEFHALAGVTFSIRHGESVALIGHNGSGKSTLLKCLAGILPADEGRLEVNGRVATLLELGAGFHPDLSGRENIHLNGSILGLTRDEIDAAFDEIVDFAGVRDFIETPVRNYSSGMYVRLGFAIAVHVDPDILLVDEVLSVGDAAFQEKSLARMRSFGRRGKTVLLVSHDLTAVRSLCERTLVLDHGRLVFDGPTDDAIEAYEEIVATGEAPDPGAEAPEGRTGDFRAVVRGVRLEGPEGPVGKTVPTGSELRLTVELETREDLASQGGLTCGINIRHPQVPMYVYETRTSWRGVYLAPPPPGEPAQVTFELDCNLLAGDYLVDTFLGSSLDPHVLHDRWMGARRFTVTGPEHDFGIAQLGARISVWNPEGVWPPDALPPPLPDGGPRYHPLRDDAEPARRSPESGG